MRVHKKTDMEKAWWREPTRGQWASFLAAWIGWVLDAFDFAIFIVVMPEIERELGASRVALTGSVTLTLLLRIVGGVAAGSAADRFGRKLPLMISMIWLAACDGAIAFAPSLGWIVALRALFGLGMGAEWVAGTTLAMENWPARSRGLISGILQGSWAIGMGLAGPVAAWIVPHWGWRAVFLTAAAPALLVLPIRFLVPESPEWERRQAVAPRAPCDRGRMGPPQGVRAEEEPSRGEASTLRPHVPAIVWAAIAVALGTGAYYALVAVYPSLLADQGVSLAQRGRLIALFNGGMLAGAIGIGWLAARRGVAFAVTVYTALVLPFLTLYVGLPAGARGVGAVAVGLFGAGIAGVTTIYLTQLFPADVRGRAVALAYNAGVLIASGVPPAMAALGKQASLAVAIPVAGAVLFTGMSVVLHTGPRYVARFQKGRTTSWPSGTPSATSSGARATPSA
jgi:SHS family lactate transporter-like MFS transporter